MADLNEFMSYRETLNSSAEISSVGVVEGAAGAMAEKLRETADRVRGWTYSGDSDPDPRLLMREAAGEIAALVADREALLERAEKAESEAELWQRRAQHAYKLLDGGHGSAVSRGSGGDS